MKNGLPATVGKMLVMVYCTWLLFIPFAALTVVSRYPGRANSGTEAEYWLRNVGLLKASTEMYTVANCEYRLVSSLAITENE